MCTVSWLHQPGGYEVFFSRDERRDRAVAEPPRLHGGADCSWICPRDPQGGGTWIFGNSRGLAACILNAYIEAGRSPSGRELRSRGLLLSGTTSAGSLEEFGAMLEESVAVSRHAACILLAIEPSGAAGAWMWTEDRLHRLRTPVHPPMTTSSFDAARVRRLRHEQFESIVTRGAPDSAVLQRYHECPGRTADAGTVRMSRPDARTVSLTRLACRGGALFMEYAEREGDGGFFPPVRCDLNCKPIRAGEILHPAPPAPC